MHSHRTRSLALAVLSLSIATHCRVDRPESRHAATSSRTDPVVYGEDNRVEVYEHPDARWRDLARHSVVAFVPTVVLDTSNPARVRIRGRRLQNEYNLCGDVRFGSQLIGAPCSGTLIADDLVLTAGHCVSDGECASYRLVFDWLYDGPGELAAISLADDVYRCASVLVSAFEPAGVDYAIIQLDRPVSNDHVPAPVRREDAVLPQGTPVTLVGFPNGLPAKIAGGGEVTQPGHADSVVAFDATVDAFSGNSGSGVFDALGRVVGVLVRGAGDYVPRRGANCNEINALSGLTRDAEDVVYVARALEALCERPDAPASLCGDSCRACNGDDECSAGGSCVAWPDVPAQRFCAPSCADDGGCVAGHACADDGLCWPTHAPACFEGDVWRIDACGRPAIRTELCEPDAPCADARCGSAAVGDRCDAPIWVEPVSQTLGASLGDAFGPQLEGSCGGPGPDAIYAFAVEPPPEGGVVTLDATVSGFDSVLHLRRACGDAGSEIACSDDASPPGGGGSRLAANLEPGEWFLVVDSAEAPADPAYELTLQFGIDLDPPEGDTCAAPTEIELVDQRFEGDLSARYADDERGPCGGIGPDRVFSFELVEDTRLVAVAGGFDTVLHLRGDCADAGTTLACNDDGSENDVGSALDLELIPGRYSLILDAFEEAAGPYTLDLEFHRVCPADCTIGERRCTGAMDVEICAGGPDECPIWHPADSCPPETLCRGAGECALRGLGDRCEAATVIEPRTRRIEGDLSESYGDDLRGACGGDGPDRVFQFEVTEVTRLVASVGGFEAVLYLRADCSEPGSELGCSDQQVPADRLGARLDRTLEAGTYALVLDSAHRSAGRYTLDVTFAALCDGACAPGDRRCGEAGVEVCNAGHPCPSWGLETACGDGERCDGAACVPTCEDQCAAGARRCGEAGDVEICAVENCARWQPEATCGGGERCAAGTCVPTCDDACRIGDRRCGDDGAVEICNAADPCPDWGRETACMAGKYCRAGACVVECRDVCASGARRCAGDEAVQMCGPDGDGCLVWRPFANCADDRVCRGEGACAARGSGDRCVDAIAIDAISQRLEGDLDGPFGNDLVSGCGVVGRDRIYAFALDAPALLSATIGGVARAVAVRRICDDPATEIACGAAIGPLALDSGPHTIVIEAGGAYAVDLTFAPRLVGDGCDDSVPIEAISQRIEGALTAQYADDLRAQCGGEGPDRVYEFRLDAPARLSAAITGIDAVLHLRHPTCDEPTSERACGGQIDAIINPGTYFLVADLESEIGGDFAIDLGFAPPCVDACQAGTRRCGDDLGAESCGRGADGCLVWLQDGVCPSPPAGDRCANAIALDPVPQRVEGDLSADYTDAVGGRCHGDGPDQIFAFELAMPTRLVAVARGFDSALHLREVCDDPATELTCANDTDPPGDGGTRLEHQLPPGAYSLAIEAVDGVGGPFTLDLGFALDCDGACALGARRCDGDGVVEICASVEDRCPLWLFERVCDGGDVGEKCEDGVCVAISPDAEVPDAEVPDAELSDAVLLDAELSDAELSDTELSDAELSDAELSDAVLLDAELSDTEPDDAAPGDAAPDDAAPDNPPPARDAASPDTGHRGRVGGSGCRVSTPAPRIPGWPWVLVTLAWIIRRRRR